MKELILTDGQRVLVDDIDFMYFSGWNWTLNKDGYPYRTGKLNGRRASILLHCEIYKRIKQKEKGFEIDHEDRDKLNCQRSNLRECTHSQNESNKIKRKNSKSIYKGVHGPTSSGKFVAQILHNHIGCFNTEIEAAKAYNAAAKRILANLLS